jgi:hypothetical protein
MDPSIQTTLFPLCGRAGSESMIEIEQAVALRASPQEVFLFAGCPENMPLWNRAVLRSELLGVLEPGAMVVQIAQVSGLRFETLYRVTSYEPFRQVGFASVSGPMHVEATMRFEGEDPGTLLRWSVRGDCRGFLPVGRSILSLVGRREMRGCLERLKALVEGSPGALLPAAGVLSSARGGLGERG